MAKAAPVQPTTLEMDEWLTFSLESPEDVHRHLALREIRRIGVNAALLPAVKAVYKEDPSATCRALAQEILLQEKVRSQRAKLAENRDLAPETLRAAIRDAHPILARLISQALRKAPAAEILQLWRDALPGEESPPLLEAGLSILARFGQAGDAELALSFLSHEDPGVVCAALDVLHHHNPELLKIQICPALSSDNPEIRVHAIRRLGSLDAREALVYINSLLDSSDPVIRQMGIPELMLIPFDISEAAFIHLIARETFPLLLVNAGMGLISNPAAHVPERIYEILLSAVGIKAAILQMIFKTAVGTIQAAGILTESMETYMAGLKTRLEKAKSTLKRRMLLADLAGDDPDVRLTAVQDLKPCLDDPDVRTALETQMDLEEDPEVKRAIFLALGLQETQAEEPLSLDTLTDVLRDLTFVTLPIARQQELLALIASREDFRAVKVPLALLDLKALTKPILLELLRKYEDFARPDDMEFLLPLLKDPNPTLAAMAIRTIGKQRWEVVLERSQEFLIHEDPRIKKAILEVFLAHNKEGALGYLKEMLHGTNTENKINALNLLAMVDFPTAEPLLRDFLRREKDDKMKTQAAMILVSNPSPETLFQVFSLSHSREGVAIPQYKPIWIAALEAAESVMGESRAQLQAEMIRRLEAEKAIRSAPPPGYAFEKTSRSREDIKANLRIEQEAETARTDHTFALVVKILVWGSLAVGFPVFYYYVHFLPSRQPANQSGMATSGTASGSQALASGTVDPGTSPQNRVFQKIKDMLGLDGSTRKTLEVK